MRVIGTISNKDTLCNYCRHDFVTCPKAEYIEFGEGKGNDNVIGCSEYIPISIFNNYPIVGKPELGIFSKAK